MKGFALDETGDVVIENGEIRMLSGPQLLRQTLCTVLGTGKGEWFLNTEEGLDRANLLGKNTSDSVIRSELLGGLRQVDETFLLDQILIRREPRSRKLTVSFTAHNAAGEVMKEERQWD